MFRKKFKQRPRGGGLKDYGAKRKVAVFRQTLVNFRHRSYERAKFKIFLKFHKMGDFQPRILFLNFNKNSRNFSDRLKCKGAAVPLPLPRHQHDATESKTFLRRGYMQNKTSLQHFYVGREAFVCVLHVSMALDWPSREPVHVLAIRVLDCRGLAPRVVKHSLIRPNAAAKRHLLYRSADQLAFTRNRLNNVCLLM